MLNTEQINDLHLRLGTRQCPLSGLITKIMLETSETSPEKCTKYLNFKETMTVFTQGMTNCIQIIS